MDSRQVPDWVVSMLLLLCPVASAGLCDRLCNVFFVVRYGIDHIAGTRSELQGFSDPSKTCHFRLVARLGSSAICQHDSVIGVRSGTLPSCNVRHARSVGAMYFLL